MRWLLFKAWLYWRTGYPLPVDLQGTLLRAGIGPDLLMDAFDNGEELEDLLFAYEQHMDPPVSCFQ